MVWYLQGCKGRPAYLYIVNSIKNRNIYYADDDADDRQLFTDVVESMDTPVDLHLQRDGQELLERLEDRPPYPTVIFLDINMPRKNGIEVLRLIRQQEDLKTVPIVIFSTSDDPDIIKSARELGANMFVSKPFSFSKFKKAITHCLSIDWENFRPAREQFLLKFA